GTAVDRESAYEKLTAGAAAPAAAQVPTGGSVAARVPGPGQSQADIDAAAREIEESILGRPSSIPHSAPEPGATDYAMPEPPATAKKAPGRKTTAPAPAPKPDNPVLDMALQAANMIGRELFRGMFGTKRRRRR